MKSYIFCFSALNDSFHIVNLPPFEFFSGCVEQNNGQESILLFIIDFRNTTLAGGHIVELFQSLLSQRKPRFDVRAQMSAISGHGHFNNAQ